MYTLRDTFNDCIISRHRSLRTLAEAQLRHSRRVTRENGPGSYIPTAAFDAEGRLIDGDHPEAHDLNEAQLRADYPMNYR